MTDVRASDSERDAAVEHLRGAAVEGRLTLEELADRSEAANRAVTRGELARLIADLPAPLPAAPIPAYKVSTLSDITRSGAWIVPEHSRYRSWMGSIVLDLRQARIAAPEVEINAYTPFGTIDLLVPEGVEVEVRARARLGKIKQEEARAHPGAPRIVLTGGSTLGSIRIRHKRLWEKVTDRLLGR
jgi:Domain of unknown function (DUF1707)/Cell wall-active antibiotics response 4TMS YvqF